MIKPLYNNILIKLIEDETITKNGLIIKNNSNDEIKIGLIIKVSETINEIFIKENTKILFNINDAQVFFHNNENYILIDYKKILGIIEKEDL